MSILFACIVSINVIYLVKRKEVIKLKERLRKIREYYNLNQRDFAKKIDIGSSTLAMFETEQRMPKDIHIRRICDEFNINENWLRNGEGEMFKQYPEDDETALLVSEILESPENPFYQLILETIRTYKDLDLKSQEVLKNYGTQLLENLKQK